jgi:hypothetical protein
MMSSLKLFMLLLGCKPPGRLTEQHDVFFGVSDSLKNLVPSIIKSWPEAKGKIHVDAWRTVTQVGNFDVKVAPHTSMPQATPGMQLFFINLGGYKPGEFDEFHYKMMVVAANKGEAIRQSKGTAFYKHMGFKGATSHVDDKYGIDVDDLYEIPDVLPSAFKEQYRLVLTPASSVEPDLLNLGYFKLDKL